MTWDVEIKEYHAVANWTWDAGDDVCSICRMPFDGCPPDCKVQICEFVWYILLGFCLSKGHMWL